MVIYKIIEVFEQINGFGTLIYNGNYGTCTMEKKLWYYGKTMILYRKIWHYTENYGSLIYYGKKYGIMERTMVL